MTLLDRYMARLRFWLPIRNGDAVAEDVRATIETLLDDRAASLGRALTDEEVAKELAAFGRPVVIASRYTHARPLVSAGLMPAYNRVLTLSIAALLIVQAVIASFDPGPTVGTTLMLAGGRVTTGLLVGFTSITLVFAALSRLYGKRAGSSYDNGNC